MAELPQEKWEGKVSAKLTNSTADQIWPLYADFCNLHKWMTIIKTCWHVEGTPKSGQIGCSRYCVLHPPKSVEGEEKSLPVAWAYEKLLTFDPVERCLSYEIKDCNMGFKNYVANIKVLRGDDSNENGCVIEWSFVTDPVEGMEYEDLVSLIGTALDSMAKRMEEREQS